MFSLNFEEKKNNTKQYIPIKLIFFRNKLKITNERNQMHVCWIFFYFEVTLKVE